MAEMRNAPDGATTKPPFEMGAGDFLYEEPLNLLKQEVREPAIYNAIITAVATEHSRMLEISTKVGENTTVCSGYLKNLISLGIIKKETPYGEKTSKKSIYSIEDNMFRFWYRFVPDNASAIARGAENLVYKRIESQLNDYMGRVFEEICTQYLWKLLLEGKCRLNSYRWGDGGETIRERKLKPRLILWERKTATRLFSLNVNG